MCCPFSYFSCMSLFFPFLTCGAKHQRIMSSLFYFAILAGVISTGRAAIQTTSVSGFYRIEVQLGHLENTLGYQANGQFCDEMTACDPVIYTSIDVEKPLAPWPTKTPTDQIMLTWRRNTNSYEINQTIYKDICGGGLSNVNARIEVMDEDFLGKYDLIEQFECKFFPPIADTTATGDSLQELSYREFTPLSECQAKHQPTKLRLFFRWRVYPIDMAECGTDPKPIANVVLVDRQTLAP